MSEPSSYLKKVTDSLDKICGKLSIESFRRKKLCVCLSGGADSTALLVSLFQLKEEYGFELCAAHVNHLLRGDEAFRDENFCIELCEKLNVQLFNVRIDIKKLSGEQKKSVEETARDARYSYFKSLGKQEKIDYFATAHTKNDNAETVYMNIIRGTTVSGLCGIPTINKNIIRPILNIGREENVAFLTENGYSFVTDSSNNDNAYTRNYIRNVLLPATQKINPQSVEAADRLSAFAESDENYFDTVIKKLSKDVKLSELHPALQRRILQQKYFDATSGKSLMAVHLDALLRLLDTKQNSNLSMPGGITAQLKDGTVSFINKKINEKVFDKGIYVLKVGENSFAGGRINIFYFENISAGDENIYNNYTCIKLYFDKIVGSIKYRARMTGDRIYCRGVNRSIKKEFIEKGIPAHLREMIPVFFDDTGIIYVPFIGAADRVYADWEKNNKKTVMIKVEIQQGLMKGRNQLNEE